MASSFLLTALSLLSLLHSSHAATTAGTQPTGTSTGSFPVITDTENSGAFSAADSGQSGASGSDQGARGLSTGAIVGISIALGLIVTAFVILWALWFTAKRRNWAVRDTLVYASRRLTGRRTVPPTPRTPAPATPWGNNSSSSNRRAGMQRGGRDDVERGNNGPATPGPHRTKKTPAKSNMKPHPGWLTEEKERSRSTSPEHAPRR